MKTMQGNSQQAPYGYVRMIPDRPPFMSIHAGLQSEPEPRKLKPNLGLGQDPTNAARHTVSTEVVRVALQPFT